MFVPDNHKCCLYEVDNELVLTKRKTIMFYFTSFQNLFYLQDETINQLKVKDMSLYRVVSSHSALYFTLVDLFIRIPTPLLCEAIGKSLYQFASPILLKHVHMCNELMTNPKSNVMAQVFNR